MAARASCASFLTATSERTTCCSRVSRPLSIEQSGRTWTFAELLALASKVFGNQRATEEWMERPAIGLAQRRPIDLLFTSAGVEMVELYLNQTHHGVYV